MNKLLLSIGIVLCMLGAQAQLFHKTDTYEQFFPNYHPSKQAQLRTETAKVSLDSIVKTKRTKEIYTYDANGYVVLFEYYEWDSTANRWYGSYKSLSINTTTGKALTTQYYDWDSKTNVWVLSIKDEYAYDDYDNEILLTTYEWDSNTSTWRSQYKNETTYDANGNTLVSASYNYDWFNDTWLGSTRSEFTYDSSGNKSSSIEYTSWNSNTNKWEYTTNSTYTTTLDANHKVFLSKSSRVGDGIITRDSSKVEYTYDANGKCTMQASYDWNGNRWQGMDKYEHVYNIDGKETLYTSYSWNLNTNTWIGDMKYEYAYNNNGDQALSILLYYAWDRKTSQWVENYKYTCDYDTSILSSTLTLPYTAAPYWECTSLFPSKNTTGQTVLG